MEYLQKKYELAKSEEDFSSMIDILNQIHNIHSTVSTRQAIRSLQISPLQERKEIYNYLWLTVNPTPETTFVDFQKYVQKAIAKKWLKSFVYVYEQRGTSQEDMGRGFHLHAIIKKPEDKAPAHCVRELNNTFKKCCDTSNYHCFNTKWIGEEEYKRKLEYILGQKESTSENNKQLKQEMDKVWRQMRCIEPYYILNLDIGQRIVNAP